MNECEELVEKYVNGGRKLNYSENICPSPTLKSKAIPLQALTGPEGSRRLRLPDFKTIGK
jgi:hypothetical protein